MDHYQTKVKESEATPPPSTTNTTRKRKASAQLSSNKVAGKKAKRKSKNHEQPDPILPEAAIDTNMDLVLQLKTTPRKSATLVKPTCQDTLDNIPNALGLVPKEAVPETNETFITPSKPLDNIDRKKTPRKAVQRNLLDDVGFKSPLKPPPGLSPARSSLTPIKLTPSPGKSSYQIASAKKISLSPEVDLNAGELKTREHGTRTPQKKGPTSAKVVPEKAKSSSKSPKIIVKISPKKTKATSDKSEVKGGFGVIKITDPIQDAKEMGEEVQRMLAKPNSSSVNLAKRLSTVITSPAKAQEAIFKILPKEAKAIAKDKREVKDGDKTDGGTHQITPSQAKPASPKKVFKTPSKITKTPSKIIRKTPSKIITTPSKIVRKATMAPAKLRNAFATTFKTPVPPSPAKNDPKTSLLTLSQAHIFFEQEPWDQPDQGEDPN